MTIREALVRIKKSLSVGKNFGKICGAIRDEKLIDELKNRTIFLDKIYKKIRNTDRWFCLFNDIKEDDIPKCKICKENYSSLKIDGGQGFYNTCSSPECRSKLGVDRLKLVRSNPENIKKSNDKRSKSLMNKYGVDHVSKIQSVKDKIHKKYKKKYNPKLLDELNEMNLELLDKYENNCTDYNFLCKTCENKFIQNWRTVKNGYKCPTCFPRNTGYSIQEKEIVDFLKSINVDNIIENSRQIIDPFELDIFLPDYNLAIEFNGLYWHSDKFIDKNYHTNKHLQCKEKGINLFSIFEDDWLYDKELIKYKLKRLLNKIEEEELNKEHQINKYWDEGTVLLELMNNDKVIIRIAFKKIDDQTWEMVDLLYYLKDKHYKNAEKILLNYFVDYCKPEKIITFVDKKFANEENEYIDLGFSLEEELGPKSFFVDVNKCKKYLTEIKEGMYKIWDCGSYKFTWRPKDD